MSTAMPTELPRRPITVEEYMRMWEEGLIAHDARVELIEGEIVEKPPMGPPHAEIVFRLDRRLTFAAGDRAYVRQDLPVVVSDISMPEPDIALVEARSYLDAHPDPNRTLLVIEVSDSRLAFDLGRKLRMYAKGNVLEVWILDVNGRKLHQFRKPEGERYAEAAIIEKLGVTPVTPLPGVTVDLTTLFD